MLLSSNTVNLHNVLGIKGVISAFEKNNIGAIDFNNDMPECYGDEHDEQFYLELKEYARAHNVVIGQAHAPFASSYVDEERTEKRFSEIVCAMKNASLLGAPMIVVHACKHLDYEVPGNAEYLFEYNLNFYRRLIPYAEEYGIKIAIENIGYVSVVSTPERLNRLYDTLNNPVFTICFDVGHCLLEKVDPAEAIRAIGHRMVDGCTHFHDNNSLTDDHILPYHGKVNWESVMEALADIGYKGNLSYEAGGFIKDVPETLRADALAYMARIGHHLIDRFEYYKANK